MIRPLNKVELVQVDRKNLYEFIDKIIYDSEDNIRIDFLVDALLNDELKILKLVTDEVV